MSQASAWFRQANSDADAADVLDNSGEEWRRCHTIAKYQQSAEKLVKSVVSSLEEAGIGGLGVGRSHMPDKVISALMRLPRCPALPQRAA